MKNYLFVICCLIFTSIYAQENSPEIKLSLPVKSFTSQIIDEENKQVILLTTSKDSLRFDKLNGDLKRIDSLKIEKPTKEFILVSSQLLSKNNLNLFWLANNNEKLLYKSFNYDTKQFKKNEFDLVFENEFIVQNFSTNKKFYILSLENNSSTLKFHIFSDTGKYEIKKVDLSTFNFFGKKEQEENFYNILTGKTFEAFLDLTTITQSTIPTLILGKRKLYINEKSITFSFDINPSLTQLFNVNLDDFSCTEEQLIQPDFGDSEFQTSKSNSYLINNKLFQIKCTSDRLVLNIIDSDRTISRKFESIPENEFTFNNSEMFQEQMSTNKLTIFDKTKQFIRKTNNYNPTVTCSYNGDSYLVTIGSRMYIDSGASSVGPMYGAVGALLSSAMTKKTNFITLILIKAL